MKNIDKLPEEVQKKYVPYLEKMHEIHKDNLISVCIYGSAAGQNYINKVSDINSVFIFNDMPFETLKNSIKTVSSGIPKKIVAPLFFTKKHIESSLDVFPIEFYDMKENHIVVYGEDILSGLEIKDEHIRLFCEQQIKGKMIRIRQAYLEVGIKKKGIEALLKESLHALMPVFRNLIRIKGKQPSHDKIEMIKQLCHIFELNENVFLPIYRDVSNDEKIADQDVAVFLEKYLNQIKKLAYEVDTL